MWGQPLAHTPHLSATRPPKRIKIHRGGVRTGPLVSVEQLSLNVAGDSAKTLSVLGNMGGVLDDCRLRFVQMCRRPPQKYPRFWGPTDFFKILPKKDPYRNHTKSINQGAKLCSRMSHTPTYPAPSKSSTKNAQGAGNLDFSNVRKKKAQRPYDE